MVSIVIQLVFMALMIGVLIFLVRDDRRSRAIRALEDAAERQSLAGVETESLQAKGKGRPE